MLFWIIAGIIVIAVTAILAGAIRAARVDRGVTPQASDMAVYRDQLAEVDRDLARGVLTEAEAEAVRVEVSRRLLDADRRAAPSAPAASDRAGILGAILVFAIVLVGGLALYSTIGAPGYGDRPLAQRLAEAEAARALRPTQAEAEAEAQAAGVLPPPREATPEFNTLMEQLRAAVAERPDDREGLTLLAQNEARLGNLSAARAAQEALVASYDGNAPLDQRLALLDLMVFTAAGTVSTDAEAVLRDLETVAPGRGEVLYYRGLVEVQSGRPDRAFPIWRRLYEQSPPDAPWMPVIEGEIRAIAAAAGVDYVPPERRGPSAADIAAAEDMSAEDRDEMIRGMVAGLADRLATDGGPAEDWARLIRALGVLGQAERAGRIAEEAETAFEGNEDAIRMIRSASQDAMRNAGGAGQ
ncbi:c-type cytochrome biogenesis protein CcmI [Alphaproteobacteria bacterium GH1-50]|uniref:C-type cytochrome biogenesis protein CcmI n=1 Tax=Kangsaoukella pontilimi TaxID=2691042 RepID=A0A7C9IRI9_9RHOB|nr:c-type cytochrome biogenesis protein CcmI [Kangsaoukella pontilimi]MXQ06985.1 c-type cytochrome biogenesis protein CcmI [Kangsaoukella pontilimi]